MKESHDYDFIVIGSGFGGSVSACRLSEKGYKVAVLEMGKRWKPEDFPKTNWNLKRYFWANLGVNPSLTITALLERAMSHVPSKAENPDFS